MDAVVGKWLEEHGATVGTWPVHLPKVPRRALYELPSGWGSTGAQRLACCGG